MNIKNGFINILNEVECHAKLCIGVGILSISIMILGFMWLSMGMKKVEYTIKEGTYNVISKIDMETLPDYATAAEIQQLKEIPIDVSN